MEPIVLKRWQQWGIQGVAALFGLFVAAKWAGIFVAAATIHHQLRVGEGLQIECDGYYCEHESARNKAHLAVVDMEPTLNGAVIGAFTVEMLLFFVISAATLVLASRNKEEKKLEVAAMGLVCFLVLASLANAGRSQSLYSKLPKRAMEAKVKTVSLKGAVIFAVIVLAITKYLVGLCVDARGRPAFEGDGIFAMVPSPFTTMALTVAMFVLLSYTTPRMYNATVAEYVKRRKEWETAFDDLDSKDKQAICEKVQANHFAIQGATFEAGQGSCRDKFVDYTMHERGKEYVGLEGDTLREKIKGMRAYRAGVRAARRWSALVALATVALAAWAAWAPWKAFYIKDYMAYQGGGMKAFLITLFIFVFTMTFVGWFTAHGIHV